MSVEPVPPLGTGRCKCARGDCACNFTSTSGTVSVVGTGEPGDPYQFIVDATYALQVVDTPTVDLTLTGSGTAVDPWVLSGQAIALTGADTTIYLSSNTHVVPPDASMLFISLYAGGAGGCGGAGGPAPVADDDPSNLGGGGGQAGGITELMIPISRLPDPGGDLNITVGLGGAGGAGGTNFGIVGDDGGDSALAQVGGEIGVARADGGAVGISGFRTTDPQIEAAGGTAIQASTQWGGFGKSGGRRDEAGAPAPPSYDGWQPYQDIGRWLAPGVGGGGGQIHPGGDVAASDGNGCEGLMTPGGTGGTSGTGGAGGVGGGYGGGGGGGYNLGGVGGDGGNGGLYGGGGGGGGAGTTSGGAGGDGANGIVVVVTW